MEDITEDSSGIVASLIAGVVFCFVILLPWFLLRKHLPYIYFPRELTDKRQYSIFRWIPSTWFATSSNILQKCGVKGVLLLQWKFNMMLLFSFFIFFSSLCLLPIYITQSDPATIWFTRTTASGISNRGSSFYWATFWFTILISIFFCFVVILHRHDYTSTKIQHEKQGGGYLRTILVKNIPKSLTDPKDIHLAFEKLSQCRVEGVSILWKPTKSSLFSNQESLHKDFIIMKAYEQLLKEKPEKGRPMIRPSMGFIPGYLTCKTEVDAIEHYKKKIEKLKRKNQAIVDATLARKKHMGIAYVVFETMKDCEFIKAQWPFPNEPIKNEIKWDISKWRIRDAKANEEILWKNLGSSSAYRNIKKSISTFVVLLFALFWTVPIAFFGNLDNLSGLPVVGPYIESFFESNPIFYDYLSGLFPAILTLLLFHYFPRFCYAISRFENHHHQSALDTSAMEKFWIFVLFNMFIFYLVFSSGVDMMRTLVNNPKEFREAFENLDWAYYGTFYCNYFIGMALLDGTLGFLRIFKIVRKYLMRFVAIRGTEIQKQVIFKPSRFKYYKVFAKEAVYFGIVITFAPIVPLISIFALLAFAVSYFSDKTLMTLCYSYDAGIGGKMMFRFIIFLNISLLLSYVLWTLFFVSHGPPEILYTAIPLYFGMWLLTAGTFIWIVYLSKIPTKKDSELWSFLSVSRNVSDNPVEDYSWEYVSSLRAASNIDKPHFILDVVKQPPLH